MARKLPLTDLLLSEVINYGGLPVSRATAHALAFAATGSKQAADMFAFGPRTRALLNVLPMTLDEARTIVGA